MITGDNIGIVNKREGIKKKPNVCAGWGSK